MRIIKHLLILLSLASSSSTSAQQTETGLWTSASMFSKLNDSFDYSVSAASRWDQDVTRYKLAFVSGEITYKISKKWDIAADMRWGASRTKELNWENMRRASTDLMWKQKLNKKIDLGMRFKAQSGVKGPIPSLAQTTFKSALRFRPAVYFDLPKGRRLTSSVEFFIRRDQNELLWKDTRLKLSLKDKVAKRKYVTVSYLFEWERDKADPWSYHVISLDFSMKKKRKTVDK